MGFVVHGVFWSFGRFLVVHGGSWWFLVVFCVFCLLVFNGLHSVNLIAP